MKTFILSLLTLAFISCQKEPILINDDPYPNYGYFFITNNRDSITYIELVHSSGQITIGYEFQVNETSTYFLPENIYYLFDTLELKVIRKDTIFYVMQ